MSEPLQDVPFGDVADIETPQPIIRPVYVRSEPVHVNGSVRQMPHSIEAEECLIATILLDGDAVLKKCATARIRADSFYERKHGLIYARLLDMQLKDRPVDIAVLAQELKDSRELDSIGGYAFLTQISSKASTTAQVNYFIDKVREQALLRDLIRAATGAVEQAYNFSGGIDDLAADIQRQISQPIILADPRHIATDWPDTISAAELLASPPVIPAVLIAGILYQGGTMLISGPSKSHKTYTMLDQAIALATGQQWLGFATVQTPVLYLNLELQGFATATRVDHICKARNVAFPANLHLWNLRGRSVSLAELKIRLDRKIRQLGAGVVMIDPHYKVSSVSGMEENSNDDQGALLAALESICTLNSAALVLSHHFAKGDASAKNAIDRASGGGVFARWGDVMLTFTPHEEADSMTVEMSLRTFAPVEPFVVSWTYPRWSIEKSFDPEKLKRRGGPKEKNSASTLLDTLGDKLMSNSEWLKASGMNECTFRRKRDALIDARKVELRGMFYHVVT